MKKIALFIFMLTAFGCGNSTPTISRISHGDRYSGIYFETVNLHNNTDVDAYFISVCALRAPSDPSVDELFASAQDPSITDGRYLRSKNKWQRIYARAILTSKGYRNFWWVQTFVPKHGKNSFTIIPSVLDKETYYLTCLHFRRNLPNGFGERGLE